MVTYFQQQNGRGVNMRNTGIKPDVIFKNFWRDNGHFASLFNTVVFGGKTVIQPEVLKECQEIAGKHKETGDKATAEEFLSGLHKGDRLHPIITIVLYYDEKCKCQPLFYIVR